MRYFCSCVAQCFFGTLFKTPDEKQTNLTACISFFFFFFVFFSFVHAGDLWSWYKDNVVITIDSNKSSYIDFFPLPLQHQSILPGLSRRFSFVQVGGDMAVTLNYAEDMGSSNS